MPRGSQLWGAQWEGTDQFNSTHREIRTHSKGISKPAFRNKSSYAEEEQQAKKEYGLMKAGSWQIFGLTLFKKGIIFAALDSSNKLGMI